MSLNPFVSIYKKYTTDSIKIESKCLLCKKIHGYEYKITGNDELDIITINDFRQEVIRWATSCIPLDVNNN